VGADVVEVYRLTICQQHGYQLRNLLFELLLLVTCPALSITIFGEMATG
jgi:hypothetical protein